MWQDVFTLDVHKQTCPVLYPGTRGFQCDFAVWRWTEYLPNKHKENWRLINPEIYREQSNNPNDTLRWTPENGAELLRDAPLCG